MLSLPPHPRLPNRHGGKSKGAVRASLTVNGISLRCRGLGLEPHGKSHATWLSSHPPPKGSVFTRTLQYATSFKQNTSYWDARGLGTRVHMCVCTCLWMRMHVCICTGYLRQRSSPSLVVLVSDYGHALLLRL